MVHNIEVIQEVDILSAVTLCFAPFDEGFIEGSFLSNTVKVLDAFCHAHPFLPAVSELSVFTSVLDTHFGIFLLKFVIGVEDLSTEVNGDRIYDVSLLIYSDGG